MIPGACRSYKQPSSPRDGLILTQHDTRPAEIVTMGALWVIQRWMVECSNDSALD